MKTLIFVLAAATLVIGSYGLNLNKVKAPNGRIINGIEASTTDFPHHVLLETTTDEYLEICGGALISKNHVLTAAHCLISSKGKAWVGSNRYGKGKEITFNRVLLHKDWNPSTLQNDIGIVYLDEPVEPNGSTIKIIELDKTPLEKGVKVTVCGFGLTSRGIASDILYYIHLVSQENKECDDFGSTKIIDKMVCALPNEGQATCDGDSGGALVKNWPENPVHVAVNSFGPASSCHRHYSRVFTRTAEYIDWIEANTK